MNYNKYIISLVIFICCQHFLLGQISDSIRIKMVEELKKNYYSKCDIDEKRAAEDAKTKTIYYINLPAPSSYNFLQGVELEEILKKDDIIFGGSWMGSDHLFITHSKNAINIS